MAVAGIIVDVVLFCVGFFIIIISSNAFVDSARAIALRLGVPTVIVGLTLVSFATTAPEFCTSTLSAYSGDVGISYGNAIGSCIANIALILALAAIARPITFSKEQLRDGIIMLTITSLLVLLAYFGGCLSASDGILLLILLGIFLAFTIKRELKRKNDKQDKIEKRDLKYPSILFALGAIGMVIGSRLLIRSGSAIALSLGVPEIVIGLTMISVGTSLPELVTAVTAVRKKVSELSLGNIIGANILNTTWVLGTSAIIRPLPVDSQSILFNNPIMILVMVLLVVFISTGSRISKKEGALLFAIYLFYSVALFTFWYR